MFHCGPHPHVIPLTPWRRHFFKDYIPWCGGIKRSRLTHSLISLSKCFAIAIKTMNRSHTPTLPEVGQHNIPYGVTFVLHLRAHWGLQVAYDGDKRLAAGHESIKQHRQASASSPKTFCQAAIKTSADTGFDTHSYWRYSNDSCQSTLTTSRGRRHSASYEYIRVISSICAENMAAMRTCSVDTSESRQRKCQLYQLLYVLI